MPYRIVSDKYRGFEVQHHSGDGYWKQCNCWPNGSGINTLSSEFRAKLYIALRKSETNLHISSGYIENVANKFKLP